MESRVYLRALEPDDYKTSVLWRRDAQIWNQLGGMKRFVSESAEREWVASAIRDNGSVRLAVCLRANDLYIGNVYLTGINHTNRSAESHVLIGNRDCWGQGYAREAYHLLLDYGFNELGLNRVSAAVLSDNIASLKMHRKAGYTQEGIRRQAVFKNGEWKDQVLFSILAEEFRRHAAPAMGGGGNFLIHNVLQAYSSSSFKAA